MAWSSPLWTLGAVDIYVDGLSRSKKPIWAEIDVINATKTTFHYYGAKSLEYRLRGTVRGRTNVETLEGYCDASTSRTLTGPNSLSETVKVMSVDSTRIPDKSDTSTEVFKVDLVIKVTT